MAFGLSSGAVSLIGAGIGLLGNSSGQDKNGGAGTTNKEPWGPSQDWLKGNIATGQKLQDYYQQNPFNPQQKTSYENLFGDLNNFRGNIAPGLMDFANNAMGNSYHRATGQAVGSGRSGLVSPGGTAAGVYNNKGLLGGNSSGPFSAYQGPPRINADGSPGAPVSQYGAIDFQAQNPFNEAVKPDAPAPTVDPQADYNEWLRQQGLSNNGSSSWMST